MPTICYGDVSVTLNESETVLEALIRAGINTPHSCRVGACHSCLVRAVSGSPPPASQKGLKASLVQKGYFLACTAQLEADLVVGPAAADDVSVSGRILTVESLSKTVFLVRVQLNGSFEFKAGQFINLVRSDGLVRSYSVASLPNGQGQIELHVREIPGGRMSGWLCRGEALGASIEVRGPAGDCFYLGYADENLLLVGAGTGLAPLLGISRDAIRAGHQGRLVVYHGGLDERGLYLTDELRRLDDTHDFLTYEPCVLRGDAKPGLHVGPIDQIVLDQHSELADWRIYLCGDPDLVLGLRKKLYLAGANLSRIHADAFLSAPS
ncbi:MAG: FAD-binding oxidoreductase [Acidobacteria bacterium]|nr:FAD-binding oxidoreductase [Acidobacteriota bacterium]